MTSKEPPSIPATKLGIRANLAQFTLLVVVNAFVGAMVGMERTILAPIAEHEFHLTAKSAVLSFIVVFGVTKALTNYVAGRLSDRVGRKPVLVVGWLLAVPVPFLLMAASSWRSVLLANALLGVSQGLTWSTTVIMKIDLAGPTRRGLAMGLNEFAGYFAVAGSALATGFLAAHTHLRPEPFYLGVVYVACGLPLSAFAIRETRQLVAAEALQTAAIEAPVEVGPPSLATPLPAHSLAVANGRAPNSRAVANGRAPVEVGPPSLATPLPPNSRAVANGRAPRTAHEVFWQTTLTNKNLSSVTQAGLVNNLNDGMAWGLFPLLFQAARMDLGHVGTLAAIYPATWGIAQLFTGAWSDRVGRKWLIASGMAVQAVGIVVVVVSGQFAGFAGGMGLLGVGTAMVYPTLLAAIGDVAPPSWRASAVGVYRLWRDLGYAIGALVAGLLADAIGLHGSMLAVAAVTLGSGVVVAFRMTETRPPRTPESC